MIAKYDDAYFNISLVKKPIRIWRYDYVENFFKKVKDSGLVVYEKTVAVDSVDEIFEVSFSLVWNGVCFYCSPHFASNTAILRTDDKLLARKYDFIEGEIDRGIVLLWYKVVSLDECGDFRFHKTVYAPEYFTKGKNEAQTDSVITLSRADWEDVHRKTVYELSPWNFDGRSK